jgi:hypothetical protein
VWGTDLRKATVEDQLSVTDKRQGPNAVGLGDGSKQGTLP